MSIPRLELCSALLLARLIYQVKHAITINIDGIFAWSDSMVVLHWLRGEASRWKPFVANRVTEIIEILPALCWRHVRSSDNPADLISRGATPAQLRNNSLWWNGLMWLIDLNPVEINEEMHCKLDKEDLFNAEDEAKKNPRICNMNASPSIRPNDVIGKLVTDCSIP